MAITINQEQRDAIWADIQLDHTALDDLEKCLSHGQTDYAQKLRQQFERHWRLLDDLGWARADVRNEFTLTMPTTELKKTIRWHRDRAIGALPDSEDADEELDIVSACDHVLEQVA
jgi:hypothetical protein